MKKLAEREMTRRKNGIKIRSVALVHSVERVKSENTHFHFVILSCRCSGCMEDQTPCTWHIYELPDSWYDHELHGWW